MKKSFGKRVVAWLLAVLMICSALPAMAFAADAADNDFLRVFHLDCGRKFFSVDEVKGIIDTLSANNYTHLELAIGNDGLRLLLDDMTVGSYSSAAVTAGIKAGNTAYSHSGEWTQAEMDTIISYAASKHIEIIPLVKDMTEKERG